MKGNTHARPSWSEIVCAGLVSVVAMAGSTIALAADGSSLKVVAPDWGHAVGVSSANASIEVCVEPPLRRGHPIHD